MQILEFSVLDIQFSKKIQEYKSKFSLLSYYIDIHITLNMGLFVRVRILFFTKTIFYSSIKKYIFQINDL